MGYGMARNIRKRMHPTATLYMYDVSRSVCERFAQEMRGIGHCTIVDSPREAAESSQTVISIVPGAKEVRQVYLDPATGVIAAARNIDRLILECSTVDSQSSRDVAEELLLAGAGTYVDTPVSVCWAVLGAQKESN
jgi:3-hydroxyisobutyrate dehydrogenase